VRLAAIDLGSNTLKYTLADVEPAGALEVVEERAQITRIGEGLDKNGYLLDAAMERTFAALAEIVAAAEAGGAERIACVATAGMRGASNAHLFLSRAKDELGLDVEIIHGLREAELAFKAPAASFAGDGSIVVFDVGGRSTELIVGGAGGIDARVSLEMGGVRLTERFLPSDPPTEPELEALWAHVRAVLATAPDAPLDARMVGVSGTIVSLAGVDLDLDDLGETVERAEGRALTRRAIEAIYEDLRKKTTQERLRGTVIPEGRADVIVAGIAITLAAMERYGVDEMIVTNRGVRFGLLFELAQG